MSTCRGLLLGSICVMGFATCDSARSFESDEHRIIANTALRAAGERLGFRMEPGASAPAGPAAAFSQLSFPPPQYRLDPSGRPNMNPQARGAPTYGEIDACVDHFMSPEQFFALAMRASVQPDPKWDPAWVKPTVSRTILPDGMAEGSSTPSLLPNFMATLCEHSHLQAARAAHNNVAHFQYDLVVAFRLYHTLAIALAQQENNYYSALVVNAIADHYLQDIFAPGHLATPREALTDMPAAASHDLANDMGAAFVPTLNSGLLEILAFICGVPVDAALGGAECSEPNGRHPVAELGFDRARLTLAVHLLAAGSAIAFKGDGHLLHETRDSVSIAPRETDAQRLLLLVVEMRSILDVVQQENTLRRLQLDFDRATGLPRFTADFGRYAFGAPLPDASPPSSAVMPSREEGRPAVSVVDALSAAENRPSSGFVRDNWACSIWRCTQPYKGNQRSPIISVGFQRESPSRGVHNARNTYSGGVWCALLVGRPLEA